MKVVKRILIFIACFVVIELVASVVAGAVVGGMAARGATDPAQGAVTGGTAAQAFAHRYGMFISLGAFIIAAAITFRLAGAVISAGIAAAIYFLMGDSVQSPETSKPVSLPSFAKTPPSTPSLVGRQMTIISPVSIDIPYGTGQIPAGASVRVLSESGDSVRVSVWNGRTVVVSRSNLK